MKFSKKLLAVLLATVLLIGTAVPAFAAVQPRWTNISKFKIEIDKSAGRYDVSVTGYNGTTKVEISANLYENRTAGYTRVDGFTASKNGASLTTGDSYSFNTSKMYKVVATAKVTTNGITETVTLEKTA